MKLKSIFAILAVVTAFSSINAFAQEDADNTTSTETRNLWSNGRDKNIGLRFGLIAPLDSDAKYKVSALGQSASDKADSDQNLNFLIGYENINAYDIGFITNLGYVTYDGDGEDIKSLRLDGNLAYGINEVAYIFGGLNMQKFTSPSEIEKFADPAIGFQLGGGAQIGKNFGVALTYMQTKNEAEVSDSGITADVDLEMSSIELALILSI